MRILVLFLLIFLVISCEKDPSQPDDNDDDQNITMLNFANVRENHVKPNKVQFMFSLRDQDNHAVALDKTTLESAVTISVSENGNPIEYPETEIVIHNADNFSLDLVLVLDFTQSMLQMDNSLDVMYDGVVSLLGKLSDNHRVGIVEFHDNNEGSNYSVIQELTFDKEMALSSLDNFYAQNIYHGFSLCWDAAMAGLGLFGTDVEPDKVRMLLLFSDGADTGSNAQPTDLVTTANELMVRLYTIGTGVISSNNELILQDLASQTEAAYYLATNSTLLESNFQLLINDLGGNYVISYITAQIADFNTEISLSYKGITTTQPIGSSIEIAEISGDTRKGILKINDAIFSNNIIEFNVSAEFIPRNINKIRFKIDVEEYMEITLITAQNGGLIADWTISAVMSDGFYELTGNNLSFGDSGSLINCRILSFFEPGIVVPFTIDNTIYPSEVFFYGGDATELDTDNNWIKDIVLGFVIGNPSPEDNSFDISAPLELGWELFNAPTDTIQVFYSVYLDSLSNLSQLIAEDLTTNSYSVPNLADSTLYYWKIRAFYGDEMLESRVWEFTSAALQKK